MKALNKIIARQTRTRLRKHDVIKVCGIEFLTLGLLSTLEISVTVRQLTFLTHPVMFAP